MIDAFRLLWALVTFALCAVLLWFLGPIVRELIGQPVENWLRAALGPWLGS